MVITFDIPVGMTAEQVAKKINTIIRQVRHDFPEENIDGAYGPWSKDNSGDHWQLDITNDYFFRFHGNAGLLRCRDCEQEQLLKVVAEIFAEETLTTVNPIGSIILPKDDAEEDPFFTEANP